MTRSFHRHILHLDPAAEVERIVARLRHDIYDVLRRKGGVLGVSGGVDSAVVLGLAVRALGADSAGRRAASEGFATSVTASFPIESESGGTVVADATSFFLSDTYGIADNLRRAQQGTARVDANRSWIDPARTKAFPRNTEIHSVLTFGIDNAGAAVRRAAPDAGAATFEVHHSLVALPTALVLWFRRKGWI